MFDRRVSHCGLILGSLLATHALASPYPPLTVEIIGNVQAARSGDFTVVARPTGTRYRAYSHLLTAPSAADSNVGSSLRSSGDFEVAIPSVGTWDVEIRRGTSTLARISAVPVSESTRLPDLCLGAEPQPCTDSREVPTLGDAYTWLEPADPIPTRTLPTGSTAIWHVARADGQPFPGVLALLHGEVVGATDSTGSVAVSLAGLDGEAPEFIAPTGQRLQSSALSDRRVSFGDPQEIRLCLATAPPLNRVAGAIARWETDPGAFAVSDGEGCFQLPILREADVLLVDKQGFRSLREPLTALAVGDRRPTMMPSAPVLVMVVDGASKPIARARVSWEREGAQRGSTRRLSSDDRGFFALHSVPPGNYSVNVETDLDSTTRLVRVGPPGSTPRWETFVLSRESSVRGRVLREDGSGVVDAKVVLVPAGKPDVVDRIQLGHRRSLEIDGIYHAATSKEGAFRLSRVSAGTYALVVRSSFGSMRMDEVVLPAEGLNLGELVLQRGPRLTVRVVDSDDQPVGDVPVAIGTIRTEARRTSVEHPSSPLTTDQGGTVIFEGLTPDSLIGIQIAARGFAEFQETLQVAEVDVERTVRLEPGLEVCGRVTKVLDGREIQDVRLTLRRADSADLELGSPERSISETVSSTDGSFCLSASSPGQYTLIAEAGGFRRFEIRLAVPSSGVEGQEVVLEVASVVRGSVTTAEGQPVSGALVHLGSAGSRTDGNGEFEVHANTVGWLELAARHDDHGGVSRQVLVPEGADVEENLAFLAGVVVTGLVHTEEGDLVANAAVLLRPVAGAPGSARRATSDGSGSFGFENVPRGEYTLSAIHRAIGRTGDVTPIGVASDPVEVDLVIGIGARVEGRVTGLGAKDTAVVRAEGPDGASTTSSVGSDGSFGLGPLRRGRWRLTLWISGRPAAGATMVEIRGGELSPLRVMLTNPLDGER